MKKDSWQALCKRFPHVPSDFRMEDVREATPKGERIRAHERPVIALVFSPDGKSIAVSGGGMIPGPADIRVFDLQTRELRSICHYHCMGVFNLAFDPRSGLLASASHDYSVVLWDLEQRDAIFLVGGPDAGISRQAVLFREEELLVADGMTFAGNVAALHTKLGTRFCLT